MRKTFFNRLMFIYLLIVVLLASVSVYITININKEFKNSIINQWEKQMLSTTQIATANVENFIVKYSESLLTIRNQPDILKRVVEKDTSHPVNYCILCELYETHKNEVEGIQLTDIDGTVLLKFAAASQTEKIPVAIHSFGKETDKTYTLLDFHPKSQSSLIYLFAPVVNGDSVIGSLSWKISISKMVEKYINPYLSENSGYLWLIDSNLNILAHHEKSFIGLNAYYIMKDFEYTGKLGNYSVSNSQKYMKEASRFFTLIRQKESGSGNYVDFAHNEYSFAVFNTINLGNQKWTMILSIPYETIFEPVRKNHLKTYLTELIIIFLITFIGLIFYKMTRHNILLEKEAEYLAEIAKSAEELKNEKQRRLAALIEGQEQERRRISREIHDSLGQQLLAMKLKLENNCSSEFSEYGELHSLVLKTISETREISNLLAPVELQESRLDEALKSLIVKFQQNSGIKTDFVSYGIPGNIDISIKTYLYRIVQEGLSNILKHAGATQADIQLLGNKEQLTLIIQDNGKGFEFNKTTKAKGNGLNNIFDRVNILKGNIELETKPGEGCCITIKISLV
ncbi:MAG TPA: histidine kinase [Bacteroidia bacterium]|nr:histidine kinase [Bacteroidia bacterium]HRS57782.1 histidine kinase [Bacteroidia bacterium]HRU67277.1 histidine kinase [Bacteroidia bacterium]